MSRRRGRSRGGPAAATAILLAASALVVGAPTRALAISQQVRMADNRYEPAEVRIDPGDSVVWTNEGRNPHTVTADKRGFSSGQMSTGDSFSHTFSEEGYYFYFCKFHGARGRVGMAGVVIVGNLPPPPPPKRPNARFTPKITVPDDWPTIQDAVDRAPDGALITIRPGEYSEEVIVRTKGLTIRGVDRFRTVLNGRDKLINGITVDGVRGVSVKNLTVRNYAGNGVFFNNSTDYAVDRVDAIKNRTYGVYAFDSYNGVIENSFGWGSGDAAFYIGECLGCGGLIQNVRAEKNYIGYSGTNATGVVIRDSVFVRNGVGVVPNTLSSEQLAPNRGTLVHGNVIRNNNYSTIPAAGVSETFGIPFGTGVWLLGVRNNVVTSNRISGHDRYGVLITFSEHPSSVPMNNEVTKNEVTASGMYDLAWDGPGWNNCFQGNVFDGPTGPPGIETIYGCDSRPFANVPYGPVAADVASQVALAPLTREQKEPPEPDRPHCQKGRPGCHR